MPELIDDYDGSLGPTSWDAEEGSEGIAIVSERDFTNIFERLVNYVSLNGDDSPHHKFTIHLTFLRFSHIMTSIQQAVKQETFPYKYNDAALAKLGMGPLWKEIMTNILPIVGANTNYTYDEERTPPKLALFSGHDTTLMPILATLGPDVWSGTEWAPYASMILIEIYEMHGDSKGSSATFPSGYAFRLIYNGAVLTSRMEGCNANTELCDSTVLLDQIMPFAIFEERDCAATSQQDEEFDNAEEDILPEPKQKTADSEVQPRQKWGIFGVALLSASLGSLITCFMMKHHYQNAYRHAATLERELSMVESSNDANYGSNVNGASNGRRVGGTVTSDYMEESDEDRII